MHEHSPLKRERRLRTTVQARLRTETVTARAGFGVTERHAELSPLVVDAMAQDPLPAGLRDGQELRSREPGEDREGGGAISGSAVGIGREVGELPQAAGGDCFF